MSAEQEHENSVQEYMKALNLKVAPRASEAEAKNGWEFSDQFIESIKRGIFQMDRDSRPSSEVVDDILIWLEENNYIK